MGLLLYVAFVQFVVSFFGIRIDSKAPGILPAAYLQIPDNTSSNTVSVSSKSASVWASEMKPVS